MAKYLVKKVKGLQRGRKIKSKREQKLKQLNGTSKIKYRKMSQKEKTERRAIRAKKKNNEQKKRNGTRKNKREQILNLTTQ